MTGSTGGPDEDGARRSAADGEMEKEAFRLFQLADLLEADGKSEAACRKYRHACRLSPELARVFGL